MNFLYTLFLYQISLNDAKRQIAENVKLTFHSEISCNDVHDFFINKYIYFYTKFP